jgi:hypothetical protein
MKTADRENPNSRDRLCTEPSPWGGRQEAPSLNQAGWKVRKFPAVGEVFFLTFPFIELHRSWRAMAVVCTWTRLRLFGVSVPPLIEKISYNAT